MLPDGRCGLFVRRKTKESFEVLKSPFKAETIDKVRKKLDKFGL